MTDDQWHLIADLCWRLAGTYGLYRVAMDLLAKAERWAKAKVQQVDDV